LDVSQDSDKKGASKHNKRGKKSKGWRYTNRPPDTKNWNTLRTENEKRGKNDRKTERT
jgi:hypothetical protein